jgi:magnesium-transporting ATPase (P-type)
MISGDNLNTAIICAHRAGILNEGEEKLDKVCMLGSDFREQVGGVRQVTD